MCSGCGLALHQQSLHIVSANMVKCASRSSNLYSLCLEAKLRVATRWNWLLLISFVRCRQAPAVFQKDSRHLKRGNPILLDFRSKIDNLSRTAWLSSILGVYILAPADAHPLRSDSGHCRSTMYPRKLRITLRTSLIWADGVFLAWPFFCST